MLIKCFLEEGTTDGLLSPAIFCQSWSVLTSILLVILYHLWRRPRPLLASRGVLKWSREAQILKCFETKRNFERMKESNKRHWTEAVTVFQAMPLLSNYLILLPYIMQRR